MEKIDLTYLQNELATQAAHQLKQLIQNKGQKIVKAINEMLKDAEDEDPIIFKLAHSMKFDLANMKLDGKLSYNRAESTKLVTAINDPEQPQFDLGDGKRGNMGVAGEGDSGAPLGDDEDDEGEDVLVPEGRAIHHTIEGKPECYCTRCGEVFADEGAGQAHLDGPMCEDDSEAPL